MPQFNFNREHQEKKESLVPKSTSTAVGELTVKLDSISVVPMGTNGYKRIFITYKHKGEDIVTEFNPPSLKSFRYELRNKEGVLNKYIDESYDTPVNLFNEDLWKNFETFNSTRKVIKEENYYYEDLNYNSKKDETAKANSKIPKSVEKYGILYAFEKLMSIVSPYAFNADSKLDISEWMVFSNKYKHPDNLLVTVTEKNIKDFGVMKMGIWITGADGKKQKMYVPADGVAIDTKISKAGKEYKTCAVAGNNPAYLEVLKSKVLDFTKLYVLSGDKYVEAKGDAKGFPAAFYSYFEMLSEFIETLKSKNAASLDTELKIFVYGDVNKFTTKEGKEVIMPIHTIDYTNTNRRWFFKALNYGPIFPTVFVPIFKYSGSDETVPYPSNRLLEKQKEYFEVVGENELVTSHTSSNGSVDHDVAVTDDDDDLPF